MLVPTLLILQRLFLLVTNHGCNALTRISTDTSSTTDSRSIDTVGDKRFCEATVPMVKTLENARPMLPEQFSSPAILGLEPRARLTPTLLAFRCWAGFL